MGTGSSINQQIPFLHPLSDILKEDGQFIKKNYSCSLYNCILTSEGQVYSWGRNDGGQLGTGMSIGMEMYDVENQPILINIKEKVKQVALGENSLILLTENDEVYVAGLKLWWEPHKLEVPSGQIPKLLIAMSDWMGYVTD